MEEFMLPCLNKKFFGFKCMGCGMQRALAALVQGDFGEAFQLYPGIFPLIMLTAVISINYFISFKFADKIISILALLTVGVIITNYIIKLSF